MKVYIDAVLLLNLFFDFLLLLTVGLVLKRKIKIFNILLGAFIGSLSTLVLFLNITSIQLFYIKVYLSLIMILVSYNYKDIKSFLTNISVFYVVSILLGGFLYLLNIEFSYKHEGIIFFKNNLSINVIVLFIISPIILYIYIRQAKIFQKKTKNIYMVHLKLGRRDSELTGYLDTGNNLIYNKRPVVFTNVENTSKKNKILVPCKTVKGLALVECINTVIYVKGKKYDVLLGFSSSFNMSGIDILLNNKMEGLDD